MKKVSVIIPCYNQGKYLDEALTSVINSTYKNIEIIVVNDGSTDNTAEIIEELKNKYSDTKFITIKNSGVCTARNTAIKNSTGEYILPLDADDKIAPQYIEKAVEILKNNEEIGIVYCEAEMFGNVNKKWDLKPADTFNMLLQNRIFITALFRKSTFDEIGGFSTDMEYGCEDWDFWLSIIEKGYKVYQIPEILFYYRQQNNQRSQQALNPANYCKIRINLVKRHKKLFTQYGLKAYLCLTLKILKIYFVYVCRKIKGNQNA